MGGIHINKTIVIALSAFLALGAFTACAPGESYEIALVTDVGSMDDSSFCQGAWEGVADYARANGKTCNDYRPSEDSNEARIETIQNAIQKGAKTVVCPGCRFASAIPTVQADYPDVNFLVLDVSADDMTPAANTALITYQEEQSGYFAGYAAVKDGYTKLGFLGGMAVPAVVRFGYGFVQGVNDAAKELGIVDQIDMKYWYCGEGSPSDDIKARMSGWYAGGTEVVFACGGDIDLSAVAAAEEAGAKVIGVDRDRSGESECFITSAFKSPAPSVEMALAALYGNGGKWPEDYAGKEIKRGAADGCTGLPTSEAAWRFKTYTVDEYDALYEKVRSGEAAVSNAIDAEPAVEISVDYQD